MTLGAAKAIGSGIATLGMLGSAIGISLIFGALMIGISRNPSAAKQSFGYAIVGAALTEAIALFALMVAFLIIFAL